MSGRRLASKGCRAQQQSYRAIELLHLLGVQIEIEKRKVGTLQIEEKELTLELQSCRKSMGGIYASREHVQTLQKQIKVTNRGGVGFPPLFLAYCAYSCTHVPTAVQLLHAKLH